MGRYTYTLNPGREEEERHTYRQSELERMTTFHLREICRRERLVVPSARNEDKDGLIRLIMRFRGQREYRHIKEACEGGPERLQAFLDRQEIRFRESPEVSIPGTITVYEDTEMNAMDGYRVKCDERLCCGNLLLVDEDLRLYTCFYLEETEGTICLSKGKDIPIRPLGKHRYFILYFPDESASEYLYDCYYGNPVSVPGHTEAVRVPLLDVRKKEIPQADQPLVIDFGSSDTTMGICLPDGSIRIAMSRGKKTIPSVIGVREKKGGETQFLFGHEAQEISINNYRDEDTAVFYDIKRWVSDADRVESVILKSGYKYRFSRREMLRAYLEHLLETARGQFKCSFTSIQLPAPIRQKEKFARLFKELLPEYTVNCELDEGMAVLFHSIHGMIREKKYEERRWYHALVIDCGGGTTDLTSGRFCIENNRVSYVVSLETRYENGDTDFGGNNLTFRILQLLKLRLVEALGLQTAEPLSVGSVQENGAQGIKEAYADVDRRYQQAERWLPTRFKEYEERNREQYFFVKNNYYYLFMLAEQIKKKFLGKELCHELRISTDKDADILLDKWKLSFDRERFENISRPIEICLHLHEIEALLRPEIYGLMARFLDRKFEKGELAEYEMIKLTGQSCKASLFPEALKQYVPGKRIQGIRHDEDGTELKLCCLEGALAYFMDCKLGYMKVNEQYRVGSLPYEIMAYTHKNEEKRLIRSMDAKDHIGYISRFHIGNRLELYLNDEQGNRLKTYYFAYDTAKFEQTTQEEIDEAYAGTVIQEETDTILEGEMKFFAWISGERWGFNVLPILRDREILYKGDETFFDFEDDTWELNFFDGRK